MSSGVYSSGSYDGWPRITPAAFTAAETTAYIIAMGAALTRTGLRIYYFRKISADDFIMFVALGSLTAAFAMSCYLRDAIFTQIAMGLGMILIPTDVIDLLMLYLKHMVALSVLTWFTIFTVKVSYLVFFWRLIDRMRWMTAWWWSVFVFVLASGVVCVVLPAVECPHLDPSMLEKCAFDTIFWREETDMKINVGLDIASDVAVISLPLALLYQVRLDFTRKLAIAAILCLSVAMIVIASIRLAYGFLQFELTDTVWLVFWQTMEAATGVTMVSITGFRSLFGQVSRHTSSASPTSSGRPFAVVSPSHSTSSERKAPRLDVRAAKDVLVESVVEITRSDPQPAPWRPVHAENATVFVGGAPMDTPAMREDQTLAKPLPPLPRAFV